MSKKNICANLSDLHGIWRVLKKVKERKSKIKFSKIAPKDDLLIVGIGDTSFKTDKKAVGGVLLFLAISAMIKDLPIYWKAKTISRVYHSS